ncbi:MAG: XisI protein [Armatimonadetes bacterium]|nr:XisI protein [Armatimonadota bacterium]
MDTLEKDRDLVERVLCELARFYAPKDARTLTVFDRVHDQYLLLDEGWDGYQRLHFVWAHVELAEGKFWILKDGTQTGIGMDLMNAGIPRERIVPAYQHPSLRREIEDAAEVGV